MGPKKQIAKQVPVQQIKKEEPIIPPHQLEGFGRFQYLNGSIYEGQWHLFDGVKMKHGEGMLKVASGGMKNQQNIEQYEGAWVKDAMHGYGVYQYPNGDIYKGQWADNQHHGKGQYEFANGVLYFGQWKNHNFDGTGSFIDSSGRQWSGQFRKGRYQTKHQKQLIKQKQITQLKSKISKQVEQTLKSMLEALSKSDKKTLKQNMNAYFCSSSQLVKQLIKQPYIKLQQKQIDKWTQIITLLQSGQLKVLNQPTQSQLLDAQKILKPQMQGQGQVVEIHVDKNDKILKAVFINLKPTIWILVFIKQ